MHKFLKTWHFDVASALITVVAVPLSIYLLRILLSHLKKLGSYALEGVLFWVSRHFMHSLSAWLSLRKYCRSQLDTETKHLFVPSTKDVKLDIDQVFVTLCLDYQGSQQADHTHRDMLSISNRIRVVGDPGSGKSSLMKKLFRQACGQAIIDPKKSRLPIIIELKLLHPPKHFTVAATSKWLYDHILHIVQRSAVYKMDECFDSCAKTSGVLVLLDGLDEVASIDYPRIRQAIEGLDKRLAELGGANVIVLTMRTQFHQQIKDDYRDNFGPALFIKPFTPTDIYDFLTRWPFQSDTNENISRIYKELTDRPTLRELCANPLILSMYVAEDQSSRQVIAPESRTQFYSKVMEELILKRRLKQTGLQPAPTKLKEQREKILGRICFDHLLDAREPANSLSWRKGIQITQEVVGCSASAAEQYFRELSKETGLFTEERPQETLRFIHLTLCEFLAAYETVQGQTDGWEQLLKVHKRLASEAKPQVRARLLEVIPFACGLMPRVERTEVLGDIVGLEDFRLLARCFFETKLYEHPSWVPFLEKAQKTVLNTPEEMRDEKWLSDLHLLNLVGRDAKNSSNYVRIASGTSDLSNFYQALVQQHNNSLSKLLNAYASQDAAAAFRIAEVCHLDLPEQYPEVVIRNCDQPPFLALLKEQADNEPEREALWASLLTEAALRSPVVARALHDFAPSNRLGKTIAKISGNAKWFVPGIVEESYYSQIITITMATHVDSSVFRMSSIIQGLRAPGCYKMSARLDLLNPVLLAMVAMVMIVLSKLNVQNRIWVNLGLVVGTAALCVMLLISRVYFVGRKSAYRQVLNLGNYRNIEQVVDRPGLVLLSMLGQMIGKATDIAFVPRDMKYVLSAVRNLRARPLSFTASRGMSVAKAKEMSL